LSMMLEPCQRCCWALRPCTSSSLSHKRGRSRGPSLRRVMLSRPSLLPYGPIRRPPGSARLPVWRLYALAAPRSQARGRGGPLQFPSPPSERSASLTAGGSSALHVQGLRAFRGLRPDTPDSAPPCPFRVGLTPRQTSRDAADRSVAPSMRLSTLGFGAGRFPPTPPACYQAPWRLPGRDLHPLAVTSLRATRSDQPTHLLPVARALSTRSILPIPAISGSRFGSLRRLDGGASADQ
jgi:hypothetical protein